jgi:hypothetical protein
VRRKYLHGYDAAQVDKQLLAMARRIVKDRELYTKLKQQLPNLAVGLSKRIEHALKKDRGIDR